MRRALIYTIETDTILRDILKKAKVLVSNKVLTKLKQSTENNKGVDLDNFIKDMFGLNGMTSINPLQFLSKIGKTPYLIKNEFLSQYSVDKFPAIQALEDSLGLLILEELAKRLDGKSEGDLQKKIKEFLEFIIQRSVKPNPTYYVFISAPIIEEVSYSVGSNFGDPSSLFGTAGSIVETYSRIATALSGNYPVLSNILKAPIWESTNPLSFDLSLLFHLKTDPIVDVVLPALTLASFASIRILGSKTDTSSGLLKGVFKVPGINASNFSDINKAFTGTRESRPSNVEGLIKNLDNQLQEKARAYGFVNILIPGIVYNNLFLIEEASVTFSKGTTINEWPIFAKVQLKCRTAFGARSFDIMDPLLSLYRVNVEKKIKEETID